MSRPIKHGNGYRIRWTDENGKRHSKTYPTLKDANFWLKQKQFEVEQVKRGLRQPAPEKRLFSEICDLWLKNRTSLKRSPRDDQLCIRNHLLPIFGSKYIDSINPQDVEEYKLEKSHLKPKTIHNHLTLLISILRYAREYSWRRKVPKIRKPKIKKMGANFRYLKTKPEIEKFLNSAKDEGQFTYSLYLIAIYTGMRQGEIAGLKWSDIDFEKRLITVQRSYDGPTKSGEPRIVPILDVILKPLQELALTAFNEIVFPNQAGKMQCRCARIFDETLKRILLRAGFLPQNQGGSAVHYITFHGLRHTFASHWMMNGGDIFKLQKILGHANIETTMIYSHLAPDAFVGDYSRMGKAHTYEPGQILRLSKSSK